MNAPESLMLSPPTPTATVADRIRAAVRRRPFVSYMAVVTLAAAIYYLLLAAPLYTSEAEFAVRGRQSAAVSPLLTALSGTQAGVLESSAVASHIRSAEMAEALDRRLGLRRLYSAFRLDPFHRLSAGASRRRFLLFYRKLVNVEVDSTSNIVTLRVTSYDPVSAEAAAQRILAMSADFIAGMSRQMQEEGARAADQELAAARDEAVQARLAVGRFQTRARDLDPAANSQAASGAIFSLEADVARLRAQLASLRTYSTASSPQVLQVQAQINNLQGQIAAVRQRLTGPGGGSAVNRIGSYQALVFRQTYADQRLAATQAAVDQARGAALQRQLFIVPIAQPTLPDEPTPRALRGILMAMFVAACLYAIGSMIAASVRDHML